MSIENTAGAGTGLAFQAAYGGVQLKALHKAAKSGKGKKRKKKAHYAYA